MTLVHVSGYRTAAGPAVAEAAAVEAVGRVALGAVVDMGAHSRAAGNPLVTQERHTSRGAPRPAGLLGTEAVPAEDGDISRAISNRSRLAGDRLERLFVVFRIYLSGLVLALVLHLPLAFLCFSD